MAGYCPGRDNGAADLRGLVLTWCLCDTEQWVRVTDRPT